MNYLFAKVAARDLALLSCWTSLFEGMVFVSPFWLKLFVFKKNQQNYKPPNCGESDGVQFCFVLFCFLKKNVWSETPCPVIWFLLFLYNIPKSQLVFSSISVLVFFSKICHSFSPNPPIFLLIFFLTCNTGHDLGGVTLPLQYFCLVVFSTSCQAHLPLNTHVQIFQSFFVFSW